jgi:protease-4
LLYINSPGGSALASELILEEVRRVALRKPVVAYVDRVAASGGYLVAMGANEFWADPHALGGSIGVYAGKFDFSQLMERVGVKREVLARGLRAARFSPSRPFSKSEEEALEAAIDEIYGDFLEAVAKARKKTVEEVRVHAEGRVFSGRRAMSAGLVDKLGGFEDAARRAMDLAKVPKRRFELSLHRPSARVSLGRVLAQVMSGQVYALWSPSWSLPGLGGSEPFESTME